jgi:hypothetical protein
MEATELQLQSRHLKGAFGALSQLPTARSAPEFRRVGDLTDAFLAAVAEDQSLPGMESFYLRGAIEDLGSQLRASPEEEPPIEFRQFRALANNLFRMLEKSQGLAFGALGSLGRELPEEMFRVEPD